MSITRLPVSNSVALGLDRIDKILKLIKKDQRAKFLKKSAEKKSELGIVPKD